MSHCGIWQTIPNARRPDGSYLVAGKNVTGFANSEEDAVGLTSPTGQGSFTARTSSIVKSGA